MGERVGGRQVGTPNKITAKAKEMLALAFEGIGGLPALVSWGKKNPDEFYRLWVRLLPTEVHGKGFAPPPEKATRAENDRDFARRVLYVLNAGIHDPQTKEFLAEAANDSKPH